MSAYALVVLSLIAAADPIDVTQVAPIYSTGGDHAWDRLHQAFYVRTFTTGETYHHRLSFDVPWSKARWPNAPDETYQELLKRIEAVERLPPGEMERAAPPAALPSRPVARLR
jgi:hypothetical protein